MIRATRVIAAGGARPPAADRVTLDFDARHRRRIAMTGEGGLSFLLDLPETATLRDGDGLLLEDGRVVEVKAKPEPLMEATAGDPEHLARLAWHIGNRHLAAEIGKDRILLRPDHVIADMLRGLGAAVRDVIAPFNPESGAYAAHDHADHHEHEHG